MGLRHADPRQGRGNINERESIWGGKWWVELVGKINISISELSSAPQSAGLETAVISAHQVRSDSC